MKVVYLRGPFPEDVSHLQALASTLDLVVYGTRFKLTVYKDADGSGAPVPGVRTREFTPLVRVRRNHFYWFYPGLSRALTQDAPDVVQVISEPWGMLPVQAATWARRHPNVALLIHGADRTWYHGPPFERLARNLVARYTLARADGYLGESDETVMHTHVHGLARDAITATITTNARDPKHFPPPDSLEERIDARRRLGLPLTETGIGFLGTLMPHKGPLVFLEAIQRVLTRRPDVWAAIAGGGPLQDEVEQRTQACDQMHFVGGLSYPEEVASYYRALDLLVVPSYAHGQWSEQCPRAIIEAMLSRCAVVASRSGSIPDMLDGVGHLVQEGDPDDLAAGIINALESDGALLDAARQRALDRYSGEAIAAQLQNVWGQAVRRRRTRF